MYKGVENPLPPKFGRMFVGNDAKLNQGPPRPNDTVTIRAGPQTSISLSKNAPPISLAVN